MATLIITADDFGLCRAYDDGMLEAAESGLVDAVSAMVSRAPDPAPLLATDVEIGLHLELEAGPGGRAGERERREAVAAIERQIELFGELFGMAPRHIDGHHHCHARAGLGVVVANAAARIGAAVRSVDARHRRLLRCRGIATPDLLIGRLSESEPLPPLELDDEALAESSATVEWVVHPGRPDRRCGSRYDRGRGEDLDLLQGLELRPGWRRGTHPCATGAV